MIRCLPRNLAIALILLYRKFISPLYGPVCRYYPSCSEYCWLALVNKGLFLGIFYTLARLFKCNPWSSGGVDEIVPNRKYRTNRWGFAVMNKELRLM